MGQDLSSLTTNLRTFHLLNVLFRGKVVGDAATLLDILGATPVIDKIFTSLPKQKTPDPIPPADTLPPAKAAAYTSLWNALVQTN